MRSALITVLAVIATSQLSASGAASASFVAALKDTTDPCAAVPSLRCLKVRPCDDTTNPIATIDGYYLTNTAAGTYTKPKQHTNATICHTSAGLQIREDATDKYPFTPFTACNSYVWQKGSAMELMIWPASTPYDTPRYYYELDMSPSGATYGAMIDNLKGNTTNCDSCKAEELQCTGANTFTAFPDMQLSAKYEFSNAKKIGWETSRFLPFSMFGDLKGSTGLFKFNLYRYDYPNGEGGSYELSGYSPTWNPSFHIPDRFALMVLV